jgi:hypothetical protein
VVVVKTPEGARRGEEEAGAAVSDQGPEEHASVQRAEKRRRTSKEFPA